MNLLLRWSLGDYNTSDRTLMTDKKFRDFIRMAKLSVYSFQKFFDADFIFGFNGSDWSRFMRLWEEVGPFLNKPVSFFDQKMFENPYPNFFPLAGVWWKWVPFRYDVSKTEIFIDTDIICVSEPLSWFRWLEGDIPLIVPQEAIVGICEATCGDVWKHMVLKDRKSLNCGVIGQKKGVDFSQRFFELTNLVDLGTYNGNFVTEQGLFNILYYSLEDEGIEHFVLPYKQNAQAKHLHDLLAAGERQETVHFTARTKLIFYDLYSKFQSWIDAEISDIEILSVLTEWYATHKELVGEKK